MAILADFVRNSLWQAFVALTVEGTGLAPKSKLKVLIGFLGEVIDCPGVDLGLEDFRSTASLNFDNFDFYLSKEVFAAGSESAVRRDLAPLEYKVDAECWRIAKARLGLATREPSLDPESHFKLFRVFCLLADLLRDEEGNAQVLMCSEEADLVFNKFLVALSKEWEFREDFEALFSNAMFDFTTFISVIELKFLKNFERDEVVEVIQDVYDEIVDDTIKKGALLKRAGFLSKYVERYVVLRSSGLTYYSNPKKPKLLLFDAETKVEVARDTPKSKFHLFYVITADRVIQFATLDRRSRSHWLASLKTAISRIHCRESYGRYLRNRRRLEWHRIRIRRQLEGDKNRELLMTEKIARQAAEDQAKELALQKAMEEEQRRHLDQVRRTLEKLLEEEIQAKQDEEMVRSLQARILTEEWEKREELEKLQDEQRKLLDMERNKTKTFAERETKLELKLEGKKTKKSKKKVKKSK